MVIKKGFSLIELIIVVGLLSLLMLAISSTMLMSVMSSTRIRTATKVKQAGNYALDQMQTIIRNAKSVTSCNTTTGTIVVVGVDGGTTSLNPIVVGTETRIASNSGIYLTPDNLLVSNFKLTCLPSDTEPKLLKISFDLKDDLVTRRASESPTLHFETSVSLRNE